MVSKRAFEISPSATLSIDSKAKQLKAMGKDVVIFAAGEPDFNTPDNIKQAAIRSINDNITRYTPVSGMMGLKNAIARKFRRDCNLNYDSSEIIVSCGGKHSLYNIAMALLEEGDEVIVPVPYWVSYKEMIRMAQAREVLCKTDEKFNLRSDYIKDAITKKTKMIILNSPNNPTGAVFEQGEIEKIAKIAAQNGIYVVSDEVYESFVYGKNKNPSIASLGGEAKKMTLIVNSVSKTYAMTGWRIGYCAASSDIISAMEKIQSHSTSNPSNAAQMAAIEALDGPQDSVREMVNAFDQRRKLMHKRLNEIDGIECIEPKGAFYAFPNISKTGMKSDEFASRLLDEALVAVVPGIAFGSDDYVRLSYAASIQDIERGLDRIEKWAGSVENAG